MIEARHLCKNYPIKNHNNPFRKDRQLRCAVDDISFTVSPGELVGYIGPNGAGKSTTIKMLTGILLPDGGMVRVDGIDPFHQRKQNCRKIGVLFGQRSQLWWHLRLDDTYRLLKHLYEIPDEQYRKRLSVLREMLELDSFWDQPVRQLSLGQRMRGELAAALLHSPSYLYLDEPTVGMDVLVKERIRELLKELNRQDGVTILLTTHDLEDVERLCSRVMVINHGKLLYDGTMAQLRSRCTADATVTIDIQGEPTIIDGLRNFRQKGNQITFSLNRRLGEGQLLAQIVGCNHVRDITIQEPPIEEVVRDLYQRSGEEEQR